MSAGRHGAAHIRSTAAATAAAALQAGECVERQQGIADATRVSEVSAGQPHRPATGMEAHGRDSAVLLPLKSLRRCELLAEQQSWNVHR